MLSFEAFYFKKWFESCSSFPFLTQFYRGLSSTEVSTALRPFYFSVHPDLFGQYPEERSVNENSLKQLSSYLETVQQNRIVPPVTLKFYLRPHRNSARNQSSKSLKSVLIKLHDRSVRKAVISILRSCDLPTTYVEKIAPQPELKESKSFSKAQAERFYENLSRHEAEFYENDPLVGNFVKNIRNKAKEIDSLREWLEKNYEASQESLKAHEPVRNEIERLKRELCENLELKVIKWDSGWNISHFRGALESFQALSLHHPEVMTSLKGKTLIFGSDTGVNLDGDVMLNCGEVRHNWLDFIKNIRLQDKILPKLPAFEKAVSRVLKDIKVVHRKFQPKVMAKQYENQLRRLTTSLSDYQGRYGYPREWPASLEQFELVVETEAGPLMLSPTGQFIVPSSCPAFLLINFITDHLQEAEKLLREYKSNKYVEKDIHRRIVAEFRLVNLRKDDNITPSLMISCCENLLSHRHVLSPLLMNSSLFITSYYSLLSDGQICIPWNWKI
ncbi:UNVERIFIED_CONTAM: hypothetical protein PYX00_006534 [Menopon gallinae]|uniref:T-cell activation inhibitor, mitochondrial n=1 Tax=Menopon gallinae TaxID=328185 RepID=A0AAW2HWK1_9NEOP